MEQIADKELQEALNHATNATNNGSKNGKKVAASLIAILAPIMAKSPDPRIQALGIALGIASTVFLKKKRKRKVSNA